MSDIDGMMSLIGTDCCAECGASPGKMHRDTCYSELCIACGTPFSAQCRHIADVERGRQVRVPWRGRSEAEEAAVRCHLYVRRWVQMGPGTAFGTKFPEHVSWETCSADAIGATPDVNLVNALSMRWVPSSLRWEIPENTHAGISITWWKDVDRATKRAMYVPPRRVVTA